MAFVWFPQFFSWRRGTAFSRSYDYQICRDYHPKDVYSWLRLNSKIRSLDKKMKETPQLWTCALDYCQFIKQVIDWPFEKQGKCGMQKLRQMDMSHPIHSALYVKDLLGVALWQCESIASPKFPVYIVYYSIYVCIKEILQYIYIEIVFAPAVYNRKVVV